MGRRNSEEPVISIWRNPRIFLAIRNSRSARLAYLSLSLQEHRQRAGTSGWDWPHLHACLEVPSFAGSPGGQHKGQEDGLIAF